MPSDDEQPRIEQVDQANTALAYLGVRLSPMAEHAVVLAQKLADARQAIAELTERAEVLMELAGEVAYVLQDQGYGGIHGLPEQLFTAITDLKAVL
jgi:hypothetical protein